MGRNKRRKKHPIYEEVSIIDAGSEGKSIAKVDDLVIFVNGAVPGDIVDLQVTAVKRRFVEARPVKFHQYSDKRVKPICDHFGVCGGCKWQFLNYQDQLGYKTKQVADNFKHLGKFEFPAIQPILASENTAYYRNKLEFTFSNKAWVTKEQMEAGVEGDNALGFHVPGRFDKIVDVDHCHLQKDPSNAIRNFIRAYALENGLSFFDLREQVGFLRTMVIRTTENGELMLIVAFFYEDIELREGLLNAIHNQFPEITSLMYVINEKKNDSIADQDILLFNGNDHIVETMPRFKGDGELKFKIGPKSFYQTNSKQAYELYRLTAEMADLQSTDKVYDLYTGTGTIANFVAPYVEKVVGVEYVEDAIKDAFINSGENGIDNTDFYAGDMKDVLNDDFIAKHGKPDLIITDPPRAGMHMDVVNKILDIEAPKVVYVSCNPATQVRDLNELTSKYEIVNIQPVDMFPHTHHVENIVSLRLR